MEPFEKLWDVVASWYARRATVWIELGIWLVVLVLALVSGVGWLIGVGAFGFVLRVVTAIAVRSLIGRNGPR